MNTAVNSFGAGRSGYYRSSVDAEAPARCPLLIELLSLCAVFTLIVWPKYAFFPLDPLPKVNPFTISTVAALFAIAVYSIAPQIRTTFQRIWTYNRLLSTSIIAWFVIRFLVDFIGTNPSLSLYITVREIAFEASFFIIVAVLASYPESRRRLIGVIVVGSTFIFAIALFEMVSGTPFGSLIAPYIGGVDASFLASTVDAKTRSGGFRVQSVFEHPILLGQYAAGIIPFLALASRQLRKPLLRLVALAGVPLAVVAVYGCGSRSGLVAGVVTFVVWMFGKSIRTLTASRLAFACVLLLVLVIFGDLAFGQLQSLIQGRNIAEVASSVNRTMMWAKASPWIARGAAVGFGDGESVLLAGLRRADGAVTIDDYYLSLILDSGILGLIAFLTFAFAVLWQAIAGIRRFEKETSAQMCVALLALVASILSVQKITSITTNLAFMFLAAGLLAGLRIEERLEFQERIRADAEPAVAEN